MQHARVRMNGANRAHASCTWSLDAAAAPPSPAPPGRLRCRGTAGTAPANAVRRAYPRHGRPDPEITIIDLRCQYIPDDQDPDDGSGPGRRHRHRRVVSDHWRNQAHGPDPSLRRQTWIPSYVKGNVWR